MLTQAETIRHSVEPINDFLHPVSVETKGLVSRRTEFEYDGQQFSVDAGAVSASQVSAEMWQKIQKIRAAYAIWGDREDKNRVLLETPEDKLSDTILFLTTVKTPTITTYFHMTARPALQLGYNNLPIDLLHWVVVTPEGTIPLAHVVDARIPLSQVSVLSRASTISECVDVPEEIYEAKLRNSRAVALAATFSVLLQTDQKDSVFLLQLARRLRDQSFVFTDKAGVAHTFSFPETKTSLALPPSYQVQMALHEPLLRSQIAELFKYWPGYWWGENFLEVALQAYRENILTKSHLQTIHSLAQLNGKEFSSVEEHLEYLAVPKRRKAWTKVFEEDEKLFTYLFDHAEPQPYSSMYNREQLLADIHNLPIDW